MVKIHILIAILATVISAVHCTGWQPGPASCECFNFVYIPKPKQIGECSSKSWFLNQIQKNYNNIQLALLINGLPYRCNFSVYQKRINEMKQRTVQLVEAYFSCNEVDCSSAIMAAYQNFVDYRNAEFNPFTRCSFTNYNTDCAQVLIQARPPAYGTAENILVGLLTCAKLKLETHCGSQKTPSSVILPKYEENQCNCVKVDPRPIPKDQCECFSPKYIATLRSFTEVNFARIIENYDSSNSTCDIIQFNAYVGQLKEVSISSTQLLERTKPTIADLQKFNEEYMSILAKYNPAVRELILNFEPSCYGSVRKARQNPLVIADAVLAVLTRCINFVDPSHNQCGRFLK